jgi:hypothetical protein
MAGLGERLLEIVRRLAVVFDDQNLHGALIREFAALGSEPSSAVMSAARSPARGRGWGPAAGRAGRPNCTGTAGHGRPPRSRRSARRGAGVASPGTGVAAPGKVRRRHQPLASGMATKRLLSSRSSPGSAPTCGRPSARVGHRLGDVGAVIIPTASELTEVMTSPWLDAALGGLAVGIDVGHDDALAVFRRGSTVRPRSGTERTRRRCAGRGCSIAACCVGARQRAERRP